MNNISYINSGSDQIQNGSYQTQTSTNQLSILEILNYLNQSQLSNKQNMMELLKSQQNVSKQFQHFEAKLDQNNNYPLEDLGSKMASAKIMYQRNNLHKEPIQRNVSKEYILNQLKVQQQLKQAQRCFREKHNASSINNPNDHLRNTFYNPTKNNEKSNFPRPSKIETDKIEIFNDGNVKNIPPHLLLDQFGMIGLAMMMKINESNKNLSLIMGQGEECKKITKSISPMSDYDSILNIPRMNTVDHLESTHSNDIYNLAEIRNKLPDVNLILKNANDDLLFYFFFMCSAECYQVLATKLLTARGWIFHTELNSWLKNNPQDRNSYFIFDVETWTIKLKFMN